MAQQGANEWHISPLEFSSYYTYYHRVTPPGALLAGSRAREFFIQTKLPTQTLSQIWKLADIDGDGQLNAAEFAVAMHLIRVTLKDHTHLPTTCPAPLLSLVRQTLYPQLPVANQAHLDKCKNAFGAFFENIGKGVLGGDAARYLMLKSNLPKPQLFHIWNLSDMDCDGRLSFLEFTIAMHLIFIAKLGYTLPVNLDPNTILPPSFYRMMEEVQSTTEQLPIISSSSEPQEPFSPPQTPRQETPPSFFPENPFVSDAFVNLPARQFREGRYDDFVGDPFETMDSLSSNDGSDDNSSARSEDFVSSSNEPDRVYNDHRSLTPDTGGDVQTDVTIHSPAQAVTSQPTADHPTPQEPSPQLGHSQLSQSTNSQASSRESLGDSQTSSSSLHKDSSSSLHQDRNGPASPSLPHKDSAPHSSLVKDGDSPASSPSLHREGQVSSASLHKEEGVSPPMLSSQESLDNQLSQEPFQESSPPLRRSQESPPQLSQESLDRSPPQLSQESLGKSPPQLSQESLDKSPPQLSQESLDKSPLQLSQESLGKSPPQLSQESLDKSPPQLSQESLDKSPPQLSQEALSKSSPQLRRSQESLGKSSPRLGGSVGSISDNESNLSQPGGSSHLSQDSVSSLSPKLPTSSRRSERSSTASFQEVVVEERVEPILQLPTAVDVVGSREATPVPEMVEVAPDRVSVEVAPDRVSVELESLSKASRQFLEESQSKLEEQQRRNLSYVVSEEYRQASLKGLSGAIDDMEVESGESGSNGHSQDSSPRAQEEVDLDGEDLDTVDMMSQLEDLEAEILSQLDDADFDLDDVDEGEEDVPLDQDQIEVGALNMDDPRLDRDVYSDEDRKTPVSDAPVVNGDGTITNGDGTVANGDDTPVHMNGVMEEPAVVKRVSNITSLYKAKEEARQRRSQYLEATMDELDNFLEDELGEINDMFQEFQTKDKESEEKRLKEEQDLQNMELKLKNEHEHKIEVIVPEGDTAESVERIIQRRENESQKIAQEWEKEMAQLEADALKDLQKHNMLKEVESDALVVTLDNELQALVKQEEEAVKIAQKEKELLAAREQAERERRERERKERLIRGDNKEEMTIEEWIEWMEEKKKAGMTPEQLEELDRRKALWAERQKQREEKRKREEEEQLAKTRRKMEAELRAIRERDQEIKSARLTDEELVAKRREKALKEQHESDVRKEQSRQAKETMRRQELEDMKPKAQSALAARWEERIRARSEGKISREENKATVLTGNGMSSVKREEERLTRRISGGPRPKSTSSSDGMEEVEREIKRQSIA